MNLIPEYSPDVARRLDPETQAVRKKITRTFAVLHVPPTADEQRSQQARLHALDRFFENKWDDRTFLDNKGGQPLDEQQQVALRSTVRDIMQKYIEAFVMNDRVNASKVTVYTDKHATKKSKRIPVRMYENDTLVESRRFFSDPATQGELRLFNIYTNHITHEGLSRLKSFGLTDGQAYKGVGYLIRWSLRISNVEGGVNPPTDLRKSNEENIKDVMGYWKKKAAILQKKSREYNQTER